MTFHNLTEGLKILAKYLPEEGNATHLGGASHDILYICYVSEVSEEDSLTLDRLGFHFNEEDGWACFV